MTRFSIRVFLILACSCLFVPGYTNARVSSLTGSFFIREGYDSNIYRTKNNEVSGWTTTISPRLLYTLQGETDSLSFSYGPGFSHDHKTDKTKVDHQLDLIGDKYFSRVFHASLRETYIRSSNTYLQPEQLIQEVRLLKDYKTTTRLWTNTVSLQTDYTYGPGGVFRFGYTNYILEHLTPQTNTNANSNYIRHNPSTSLSYRFNNYFGMLASYGYIKGDFDSAPDLETNNPGLRLNYIYSPNTTFFGSYDFSKTDYSGNQSPPSYKTHAVALGTDHAIDPKTKFSCFAGFARNERQSVSRDAFNFGLNLTKALERGALSFNGNSGFEQANFNGQNDGLSRYWSVGGSLNYQLTEKSNINAYAGYRHDDYLQQTPPEKENAYSGGGGYSFLFARWYTISFQYGYLQVNSNNSANDYIDNRFYIAFGAAKELWRW